MSSIHASAQRGSRLTGGTVRHAFVTDTIGWRWVFLLDVPGSVLMILGILAAGLPAQQRGAVRDLDVRGAMLATGGLSLLVWTVLKIADWRWSSPKTLTGLGIAAVLLATFVVVESKVPKPLLDLKAFASGAFAIASLATAFLAAELFSMFFFLTQYMQMIQGFTPWQTGVRWIPWSITLVLVAGASTKLLPKIGARVMVTAGALIGVVGFWLCTRLTAGGSYANQQLPALICMGVGIGLSMLPLAVVLTRRAAPSAAGEISAVMTTLQQIGGALGVASLASIAVARAADAIKKDPLHISDAYVTGFHSGFWVAAGLMVAVAILGLFLPSLKGEVTDRDVISM